MIDSKFSSIYVYSREEYVMVSGGRQDNMQSKFLGNGKYHQVNVQRFDLWRGNVADQTIHPQVTV